MNPFSVDSAVNYRLMPLLYDSLLETDEKLQPERKLAAEVSVQGTQVLVTLRGDVRFTDGHTMTSADVVYSYNQVLQKGSGPYYQRISNIAAVRPNGGGQVVFTLKSPDPKAANLLDLPIVENNTGAQPHPVGSGRYLYKNLGNTSVLNWNKNWYGHATPAVRTINLLNMPDDAAVNNSLNIGMVDYGVSDSGGVPANVMNKASSPVNLNQLLFIGVNRAKPALKDAHVRRAVSVLLNRKALVDSVYPSRGSPATLPFNPLCPSSPKQEASDMQARSDAASSQLALAGYTAKNPVGALQNEKNSGLTLSFTLLVNKSASQRTAAAQKIANQLQPAGILIKVQAVDGGTLTNRLKAGQFDLYLGEIRLPQNLDVSQFFVSGGAAAYGRAAFSSTYQAFVKYRGGQGTLGDVAKAFADEMPFVPICFRMGAVAYQQGFFGNIIATSHDIFYNIQDWK